MQYRIFFLGCILCLNFSCSAMEEIIEALPVYKPNLSLAISDEKERQDAALFIACLDGFKGVAENALTMHMKGHAKLSDREIMWLKSCIKAQNITRVKVEENRGAVYRKMCKFAFDDPESMVHRLEIWQKWLEKKKINQDLFNQQKEQVHAVYSFFDRLKNEGIICKYPRTVTRYKSAL